MSLNSAKKIWQNKGKILEGIANKIFPTEAVESVAQQRLEICKKCEFYDEEGTHCLIPGTQPCCGECGCSLAIKTYSMSAECGEGYWDKVLTFEEEDKLEELKPEDND
jgi:hypothetical protein